MKSKKILSSIILAGVLTVGVAGSLDRKPEIRKYGDMTGDGIKDILMYEDAISEDIRGNYLFIGKKDDTFIRTQEKQNGDIKYFLSDDGIAYFFDGKFYKPSQKNVP